MLGRHFTVRTDQQSLKYLLEQPVIGTDYQKWVTKLMGFDFEIQFRRGANNKVADTLSRISKHVEYAAMSIPQWQHWDTLQHELWEDNFLKKICDDIESDPCTHMGFSVENGVLYYKGRLVIPKTSTLISNIIWKFHSSPMGGHSGESKTYQQIAAELFW